MVDYEVNGVLVQTNEKRENSDSGKRLNAYQEALAKMMKENKNNGE